MAPVLDFKCAIVTGGAGGLGRALAEYFLSKGKKVILVGRTQSKLEQTSKEINATAIYTLDTGDVSSNAIASFVATVTKEHPEVDCLVNNAGIQYPLFANGGDLSPEEYMKKASAEMDVNVRGPMALILHLLPHFKTKPNAVIMNITSGLAYNPVLASCPVYCATKSFMRSWTLNLRSQLKHEESTKHVQVVEIVPPMVETDLHRSHEDPDNNKKEKNKMSLTVDEFMRDVSEGLEGGEEIVGAGMAKRNIKLWYDAYGGIYEKAVNLQG